jgi:hypothetical protein
VEVDGRRLRCTKMTVIRRVGRKLSGAITRKHEKWLGMKGGADACADRDISNPVMTIEVVADANGATWTVLTSS